MMRIRAAAVAAMIAGGVWGGGGCAVPKDVAPEEETPVIEVRWTGDPIQVDGVLDEAAWTEAPVVSLRHLRWNDLTQPAAARASGEKDVFERGTVRFLYDDRYFYIGFELEDADVVARGRKNGLRHHTPLSSETYRQPLFSAGHPPDGRSHSCRCFPAWLHGQYRRCYRDRDDRPEC